VSAKRIYRPNYCEFHNSVPYAFSIPRWERRRRRKATKTALQMSKFVGKTYTPNYSILVTTVKTELFYSEAAYMSLQKVRLSHVIEHKYLTSV
jgi:hypothetical protein